MNINNQLDKVFYVLIFILCSLMFNYFDEDNVCFYFNDGYIEKGGVKKFCVLYYIEDEWLFSLWNNNIVFIKILLNFQVDVFSDFLFMGKLVLFYKNINFVELEKYGLIFDISFYCVLFKKLYFSNK